MGILHIIIKLGDAKTIQFETIEKKMQITSLHKGERMKKNGTALGELTKDIILSMEKGRIQSKFAVSASDPIPNQYHPITISDQYIIWYKAVRHAKYWYGLRPHTDSVPVWYDTVPTGTANLHSNSHETFPMG